MKTLIVDGANIQDIASFYTEINRVFMMGEDWQLGQSLDALDDMLYGGYGAIDGSEPVRLIWLGLEQNRADLGLIETRAFYRAKLDQPAQFNADHARKKLAELYAGTGQTYFEIVLEIIGSHPNIELVAG